MEFTRRGFIQSLGAAAIGLTLARQLPGIAPAPPTIAGPVPVAVEGVYFTRGDVFTIAGRYAHHPVTGAKHGILQTFVVTSDVTDLERPMITWPIARSTWDGEHVRVQEHYEPVYPWEATRLSFSEAWVAGGVAQQECES